MTRKDELQVLLKTFGRCGCEGASARCPLEQYGEHGAGDKPNGRFSVCELEADKCGLVLPEAEGEVEP